jgi:hypothetical protein
VIRPLRRTHAAVMTIMAAILPLLLAIALAARRQG